jgi:hypothetical protein
MSLVPVLLSTVSAQAEPASVRAAREVLPELADAAWELEGLVPLAAPWGSVAVFVPRLQGWPVELSARVRLDEQGRVVEIRLPELPQDRLLGEVLPLEQAVGLAQQRAPGAQPHARLSWQPVGGMLRRVWTVELSRARGGVQLVQIDAVTGGIVGLEQPEGAEPELPPAASLVGRAYLRNPLLDSAPVDVPLPTATQALADERALLLQCRDQGQVYDWDHGDGVLPLHVCTREPVLFEGRDWRARPVLYPLDPARDEDDFAGPHAFFQALRGLDWFTAMGWAPLDVENDPRLHVVVNYRGTDLWSEETASDPQGRLLPYDNAYFTGGYETSSGDWVPPQLVLGQGSVVDLAYDADVVHHELAHYVVRSRGGPTRTALTDYGPSLRSPALNEGFADYFSSAIQGDPAVAEFVGLAFERDSVRDLSGAATCAADLTGESHYDSLVVSQPLWQLRASLPAQQQLELDKLVMDGLTTMGSTADFAVATGVLTDLVRQRLGEPRAEALAGLFAERGLPECPPVRELQPAPAGEDEPSLSFTQIPAAWSWVTDGEIPGYLQLRVLVPEGGAQVRLTFSQEHWLGLDPQGDEVPQRLGAVGRSGERMVWSREPVEIELEEGEPLTVDDWRSDGSWLGASVITGVRPDPDDPQYELVDEELVWSVTEPGPFVFQLVNEAERLATAEDLRLELLPLPTAPPPAPEAPRACGCSSAPATAGGWAAILSILMWRRGRLPSLPPATVLPWKDGR